MAAPGKKHSDLKLTQLLMEQPGYRTEQLEELFVICYLYESNDTMLFVTLRYNATIVFCSYSTDVLSLFLFT